MKCCVAALYLPLFYKLGTITSKFMQSIFGIGYSSPLRGGFLSQPAPWVVAQLIRPFTQGKRFKYLIAAANWVIANCSK